MLCCQIPQRLVLRGAINKHFSDLIEVFDRNQLCCGHDLTEILAIGVRQAWGTNLNAIANVKHLEKLLRIAYSLTEFEKTGLYNQVINWQLRNFPFTILY